jgi:hypothetical protein
MKAWALIRDDEYRAHVIALFSDPAGAGNERVKPVLISPQNVLADSKTIHGSILETLDQAAAPLSASTRR